MAALDLTDIDVAKTLVTERFGSLPSDAETLLIATAADDCGDPAVTTYRPYYVIGLLMGTYWQQYKAVRSASGASVEYASPAAARQALLDIQAALDLDLCNVPSGFTGDRRFVPVM